MQTKETEHLDFLLSEYVADTLPPTDRKFVEQQLASNPDARGLFKAHRDVQDLLDDYGNRLPMIDWNAFDRDLGAKLDQVKISTPSRYSFTRWLKPAAIAASLALAVGLGYGVHALTNHPTQAPVASDTPAPKPVVDKVHMEGDPDMTESTRSIVRYEETAPKPVNGTAMAPDGEKSKTNFVYGPDVIPHTVPGAVEAKPGKSPDATYP